MPCFVSTSTSTVGLPLESRISHARTAVISPSPAARKLVAARLTGAGAKAVQVLRSSANTMRCAMALLISWLLKLKAVCSLQMLFSWVSRRVLRLNYESTSSHCFLQDAITTQRGGCDLVQPTEHVKCFASGIQLGVAASVVAKKLLPRALFAVLALGRRVRLHEDSRGTAARAARF